MEVYDDTEVFIVCPAYEKSGGPFALHQLAHELRKRKIDAMMAYTGTARDENPVAEPYRKYHIPFVTDEVVRGEHNILICPETMVGSFPRHMRHIFWWLSVDNWAKTIRQQLDRALYTSFAQPLPGFISPTGEAGTHWAQSEYAERFLRMNHVTEQKIHHVSDYLDPIFLSRHADDAFDVNGRRDIVAYNPAKGAAFTRKLQQAAPDIHWVRIEHMTEREVEDCLSQAKVYIDFGGHPGKDRIPREAAICGCCVVTGRRGAAGNDVDVPINQSYKFADCEENIPSIIDCVRALLAEYPQRLADFAAYRALIRREKARFEREVEAALPFHGAAPQTKRLALLLQGRIELAQLPQGTDWEKREDVRVAAVVNDAAAGSYVQAFQRNLPVISNEDAIFLYREGRLEGFLMQDVVDKGVLHIYTE